MYQVLKKIKEAGKMVSFFNDTENDDRFGVGFILALNQEELLIESISPNGEYDGYMWLGMQTIFQCNFDGEYEKKIMDLHHVCERQELDLPDKEIRKYFLDDSMSKKRVVEIVYLSKIISGYVLGYNNEVIVIREINQYGKDVEMVCIKMEWIDELHMDTITCRETEKLIKINQNQS